LAPNSCISSGSGRNGPSEKKKNHHHHNPPPPPPPLVSNTSDSKVEANSGLGEGIPNPYTSEECMLLSLKKFY
jgi:hypothetical protein